MFALSDQHFKLLADYVYSHCGINLFNKKPLVEARLYSLLVEKGFNDYSEYYQYAINDASGGALSEMVDRITTNHTYFMREMDHFNFFRNEVLPYLKTAVKDRDLRIWSAGCSSGQEPYTLAMILADYFQDEKDKWDTTVLATDISSGALEAAREGIYSDEALSSLPNHWKLQYIKKLAPNQNVVSDAIKKRVVFRKFNLMEKKFPFKKAFHVIFCRNVMIYFDNDTKRELVKRYYDSTVSGGYLFIGQSESLNKSLTDYKYIIPAVYRKG